MSFISSKKLFSFLRYSNFLYFHLPFFFSLSAIALEVDPKKNLKVYGVINCQYKNLVTQFVSYLEKEISCDIETLSIDGVLNKEHFHGKIMQKLWTPF